MQAPFSPLRPFDPVAPPPPPPYIFEVSVGMTVTAPVVELTSRAFPPFPLADAPPAPKMLPLTYNFTFCVSPPKDAAGFVVSLEP